MSYDNLTSVPHRYEGVSLAAGGALIIPIPKGSRFARVLEVIVQPTTAVVATTTPPRIDVGYAGKSQGLATMEVPNATGTTAMLNSRHASFRHTGLYRAGATELSVLSVTITAGVGGAVAGAATITVVMGYDRPEVSVADRKAMNP